MTRGWPARVAGLLVFLSPTLQLVPQRGLLPPPLSSSPPLVLSAQAGTERPRTSPLDKEKRPGTFLCAGCSNPLFDMSAKFDSGTGW